MNEYFKEQIEGGATEMFFYGTEHNGDPYDSYDIGYDSATQNIRTTIKEHFGVE